MNSSAFRLYTPEGQRGTRHRITFSYFMAFKRIFINIGYLQLNLQISTAQPMASLVTAPIGIVDYIFRSCDSVQQLVALTSTCKHLTQCTHTPYHLCYGK